MSNDMLFEPIIPLAAINYAPLIMGVVIYSVFRYMRNKFDHVKFINHYLNGDFDKFMDGEGEESIKHNEKYKELLKLDQRRSKIFGYLSLVYLAFITAISLYFSFKIEDKNSVALLVNAVAFCSFSYDAFVSYQSIKKAKEENKLLAANVSEGLSHELKGFLKKEKTVNNIFFIFNIAGIILTASIIYWIIP